MESDTEADAVAEFLPAPTSDLRVAPFLDAIAAQAAEADRSRSVDPAIIADLKTSDVLRLSATKDLGGVEASMIDIGRELAAVSARCPSLAWALWNHVCVFHLFVGSLGPEHADFLADIVEAREWVSFPAGAGSGARGTIDGDVIRLNGKATWATGARYGDWCGVVLAVEEDGEIVRPLDLRFTMIRNDGPGVRIDPTWDGSGLRASATDDIHYENAEVPIDRCVSWFGANRAESLRTVPVVSHRYREDWVGLSDLWLGWMATAIVRECLIDACAAVRERRVIMGAAMVERPTVQINIGRALSLTASAQAAITEASAEVDRRIEAGRVPDTADYYRQQAIVSMAVEQLDEAMSLLTRSQGGTALREGADFDRRARDFRAMPLHINVHQDRVTHQVGRLGLGVELAPF